MIYVNDIIPMKMYRKPFMLPIDMKDKKKNSAVMLLTPNFNSTLNVLNNKLISGMEKNFDYYQSYYIEKDISAYINGTIAESVELDITESAYKVDHNRSLQVIYNGKSHNVERVYDVINADYILQVADKLKIKLAKNVPYTVNIVSRKEFIDKGLYSSEYVLNLIEYGIMFRDKKHGDVYDNYLKCSLVQSLLTIENPEIYVGLMEGFCYFMTGYNVNFGLGAGTKIAKVLEYINMKSGYSEVLRIVKTNNLKLYQKWALRMNGDDISNTSIKVIDKYIDKEDEDYFIDESSPSDIPTLSRLKRKITMGGRKGVYKLNLINKIQDVNDPHTVDGEISTPSHKKIGKSITKHSVTQPTTPSTNSSTTNASVPNTGITNSINKTLSENAILEFNLNSDDIQYTDDYIRNENSMMFFENDDSSNKAIKKMIYKERLKSNKEVFALYDRMKESLPAIKYTYSKYELYKKKNLFIDFSYYNTAFFKNNMYKLDRGVNIYLEFLNRLINDKRISNAGYKKKFVIVPVNDWDNNPETAMWMYNKDINPVSVIYRLIKTNLPRLAEVFKDVDFLFLGENMYFKVDFSKMDPISGGQLFLKFIKRIRTGSTEVVPDDDDTTTNTDSSTIMAINMVDKIEKSTKITMNDLSPIANKMSKTPNKLMANQNLNTPSDSVEPTSSNKTTEEQKQALISAIADKAISADTEKELLTKLDNDEDVNELLYTISSSEGYNKPISDARASRIIELNNEFESKTYGNRKISDIINTPEEQHNEVTVLDIDTVNEDMKNLSFINHDKDYDINEDIIRILKFFGTRHFYPISVRDFTIKDESTSEDYILNYSVQMEDSLGKRFSLNFDIPQFKDDKYMILRGNKKTIQHQLFMIPLSKSDEDKAQMVSNYSKIFISKFGSSIGKTYIVADKIIKCLKKNEYDNIKVTLQNNSRICIKYDLPIDYIDMASVFGTIVVKCIDNSVYKIYFNQEEIRSEYGKLIDDSKGIPIGTITNGSSTTISYYKGEGTFSDELYKIISLSGNDKFINDIESSSTSTRYAFSRCSILNENIPLIIVCCYSEGLTEILKKANIEYSISEKRPKLSREEKLKYDVIKFKDGFLVYKLTYSSSLLMNGLRAVPIDTYSIFDMDKKTTYIDMLDLFGGRIKGDGLDNFYDLFVDPITEEVCRHYKLPEDYIGLMLRANDLLADSKFATFTSTTTKRIRRKEIIAGYAYLCLAREYGNYCTQIKHGRHVPMSIKKSAIIDAILQDNTMGDLSILNPLLEIEAYNAVSAKGLTGMNSDRGYTIDKRGYNKDMENIIALSTGFAGTVGVNRQLTMDANVDGGRGYVTQSDAEFTAAKSLSATEGLLPFGTTRDDPFRSAMTFTQWSKHGVKTKIGMPSLISNGADEALPYMLSNTFAFKSKDDGEVIEKTDDYMIIKYKDDTHDIINLSERSEKNSSGGFSVPIKLDTDYDVGYKFKKNEILAYDHKSFSPIVGSTDNISYNLGTLTKAIIINTDEGYQDSTTISANMSRAMTSEQILKEVKVLPPQSNIYNVLNVGDPVQEGEPMMVVQTAYEDEDVNKLLKNLIDDEDEISNLGRIEVKAPINGVVEDIIVYRTVELDELSPTLKDFIKKYEKPIDKLNKKMKEYNIDDKSSVRSNYVLPTVGKLKNVRGVMIEFYVKYSDRMSVGDKLINLSALKGVVKDIMPEGEEPYTLSRPNERIDVVIPVQSVIGRMVCSILINGAINRCLIELDRANKDDLGIKWNDNLFDLPPE